ncbi:MAG: hypothetical protein KBD76_08230 [Bacteriovorax sp.]|mgnify:CR=1 FL=1|jgi:hypothetical protein|nr:hypothetical protein [Bacteriovorax sp.]
MNKVISTITFFILFFIIAQKSYPCGDYVTNAKVVLREGSPSLIIYPGSLSEIYLKFSLSESFKLAPYLNRYVKADLFIQSMNDKTHYKVEKISHITPIPPPLLSIHKGTSLVLVKKSDCK